MGHRAVLDKCEKSCPNRDSIPGPSSPKPDAIPTEPLGPQLREKEDEIYISVCTLGTIQYSDIYNSSYGQ